MFVPEPSPDIFRTPHFDEFCEAASDYFNEVDTIEALNSVNPHTIEEAIWHPGQFLVIHARPLDAVQEGQIRLHIWPQGIDRCDTDIHNHSWHMASKVAVGTYVEHLPTVSLR